MTISNVDLQNVTGNSFAISTVSHGQGTSLLVEPFHIPCPTGIILKRVPRGAHLRAEAVLESCLRWVLPRDGDLPAWMNHM